MKFRNPFLLIIGAVLVLCLTLVPYFISLHPFEFSDNNQDWAAFGGYLSGITSVFNLLIFIYLTFQIHKFNVNKDERDLKNQKLITLTQFRQSELDKLTKELDRATENTGDEEKNMVRTKFSYASVYLTNFKDQKTHLFPILKEENVLRTLLKTNNLIIDIIDIVERYHGKEQSNEEMDLIKKKFIEYLDSKTELLNSLQEFIIKDLEQ